MSLKACSHEKHVFSTETRKVIVKMVVDILVPRIDEFDAIAVSGYSSALIGSIIAEKLNKNILLVRKESEERQSSFRVEGHSNERVVFIDDLVDTGSTVDRIKHGCKSLNCRLVGLVLYNECYYSDEILSVPTWGKFNINDIIECEQTDEADFGDNDHQESSEGWTTEEEDDSSIGGWTT